MSRSTSPQEATAPRVAIVTGAARGIGRATAVRLAEDGMNIAVLDIDRAGCEETLREVHRTGRDGLALEVDVTDETAVAAVVDDVAARLAPPSVLINNAGITRDQLIFKMSLGDWNDVINVHMRGAFLMTRATQSHMVKQGWGRVVNLSSVAAWGNRGQVNYSAAKAGLQGFTRTLAIELGRFGITANAVAPGFVETQMTVDTAHRLGISFEQLKESGIARIAAGRIGQPADIAAAVAFFVRDEASFVSGQTLVVDGGSNAA